jgi:hypothetical protein
VRGAGCSNYAAVSSKRWQQLMSAAGSLGYMTCVRLNGADLVLHLVPSLLFTVANSAHQLQSVMCTAEVSPRPGLKVACGVCGSTACSTCTPLPAFTHGWSACPPFTFSPLSHLITHSAHSLANYLTVCLPVQGLEYNTCWVVRWCEGFLPSRART